MPTAHSLQTPVSSRAPTPASYRYRSDFDDQVGRSRSRVRPGRIPATSTIVNSASSIHPPEPRTRRTRFASPAKSDTSDDLSRRSQSSLHKEVPSSFPDERQAEISENAKIWQIYVEVSHRADTTLIEGWNRSMDVLLVFIGLFSAVLTTFIIQSYQLMIANPVDTSNALLAQLVALQQGVVLPAQVDPSESPPQIRWVNGLWFAALSCSLSTALIIMLAKQWLQAYLPIPSGTPRQRARQRQAKYLNLQQWHVPAVIDALPFFLHVALLLFFAGLVVLLWSVDIGITCATWLVVVMAYGFYFMCIWLPLAYPDCPYRHPISAYLLTTFRYRTLKIQSKQQAPRTRSDLEMGVVVERDLPEGSNSNDMLDAKALAWLLATCTDSSVVSASLEAIAGLPRDFTAYQVLRDAGALQLVEQAFQNCFQKDETVDLQWHLTDPEGAELYCRAWIKLTRDTQEQWPFMILEPLWVLQDTQNNPDGSAIASCAVALSSFESYSSQWELLSFLSRCVAGEIQLSQTTQCCLLDSIIECIIRWEMPAAVVEETNTRAVPTLLRMLRSETLSPSLRGAVAVALYLFTKGDFVSINNYWTEETRRTECCSMTLAALSVLVEAPERFAIRDSLLDIVTQEMCRLAPLVVAQSEKFSHQTRDMARYSLSTLFLKGRIGAGLTPDDQLADVLQLLFPPEQIPEDQTATFIKALLEILETNSQPGITNWAILLLEVVLTSSNSAACAAFAENNGVLAVLRAARAGEVDSRTLQIYSLRALCAFIDSLCTHNPLAKHFDHIFQSDFFEVLCSVVASRRWWLFEVSGHWMPALVRLCRIRPNEAVWKIVEESVRDFAEGNICEEGYAETLAHLDTIASLRS